eukprot:jgi/Mesen1/4588/ME000232S03843
MDSLLSTYASDSDEEEPSIPPAKQSRNVAPAVATSSGHASNVNAADGLLTGGVPSRSQLFSALPPPKQVGAGAGSLFSSLPAPRFESDRPSVQEMSSRDVPKVGGIGSSSIPGAHKTSVTPTSESSVFPTTQPEAKPALFFSTLPKPKGPDIVKKKVVSFRPPVNMAVLDTPDDEEDEIRAKKRAKAESAAAAHREGKTGLAAFLPAPKHSLGVGAALGGGAASGGRRAIMEVNQSALGGSAGSSFVQSEATSLAGPQQSVPGPGGAAAAFNREEDGSHYVHPSSQYAVRYDDQGPPQMYPSAESHPGFAEAYQGGGAYGGNEHYQATAGRDYGASLGGHYSAHQGYQGSGTAQQAHQAQHSYSTAGMRAGAPPVHEDPLEKVLASEKRRGNASLPQFKEVKQSELTGGGVREDQLRATGIAFGPAYQPVSTSKDKPSKAHRRKHQIGSLYFDMKQKEMETMDKRAKGLMSKSETHAKYGW